MRLGIRSRVDVPDRSDVAPIRPAHGSGVIAVVLALAEEKNILMATRGPVFHALRLAIRFVPNDVGAEIPAFLLESKSQQPGNTDQILGFQPFGRGGADVHRPHWILFVGGPPGASPG